MFYDKVGEAAPFHSLSGISVTKEGLLILAHGGALMEIVTLRTAV